jgi:hypothetical protein
MVWIGYKVIDGNGLCQEIQFPNGNRVETFDVGLANWWLSNLDPKPDWLDKSENNESVGYNDDLRVSEYEPNLASETWVAASFFPSLNKIPGIVLYEIHPKRDSGATFTLERPQIDCLPWLQPRKLLVSVEAEPEDLIEDLCVLKKYDLRDPKKIACLVSALRPFYEEVTKMRAKYLESGRFEAPIHSD